MCEGILYCQILTFTLEAILRLWLLKFVLILDSKSFLVIGIIP